ncbi:hypothetical protein BH10PLA2_BH10PLA2_09480 [soil metagenome]
MTDNEARIIAFLERCEVRLSTMHELAGALLGGTVLLLTVPLFFRDIIFEVFNLVNNSTSLLSHNLLLMLVTITVSIPFLAFIYLLHDLAIFYFVIKSTTICVSGLHRELFNHDTSTDGVRQSTKQSICAGDSVQTKVSGTTKHDSSDVGAGRPAQGDYRTTNRIVVARPEDIVLAVDQKDATNCPGLARSNQEGSVDCDLVTKAANTEVSLVCIALALKRLVLRYIVTLLVVPWTLGILAVSSNCASAQAQNPGIITPAPIQVTLALSFGFFLWSMITPFLVRLPLSRSITHLVGMQRFSTVFQDSAMVPFELGTAILSIIALGITEVLFLLNVNQAGNSVSLKTAIAVCACAGNVSATYWIYQIWRNSVRDKKPSNHHSAT